MKFLKKPTNFLLCDASLLMNVTLPTLGHIFFWNNDNGGGQAYSWKKKMCQLSVTLISEKKPNLHRLTVCFDSVLVDLVCDWSTLLLWVKKYIMTGAWSGQNWLSHGQELKEMKRKWLRPCGPLWGHAPCELKPSHEAQLLETFIPSSSMKLGTKSLTNRPLRDILDTECSILIHVIKDAGSFYSQKVFSLLPGVPKVPTISASF